MQPFNDPAASYHSADGRAATHSLSASRPYSSVEGSAATAGKAGSSQQADEDKDAAQHLQITVEDQDPTPSWTSTSKNGGNQLQAHSQAHSALETPGLSLSPQALAEQANSSTLE